jgi:hypothetical protein
MVGYSIYSVRMERIWLRTKQVKSWQAIAELWNSIVPDIELNGLMQTDSYR